MAAVPGAYGSALRDGFVCRTPYLASTLAGGANVAHLEVSMPRAEDSQGLLVCLTTEGAKFERDTTSVDYLSSGGSQFANATEVHVGNRTALSGLRDVSFFSVAESALAHEPVELVEPADVFAYDAYHRDPANYYTFLLDTLVADSNGNSLLTLPRARPEDYAQDVKQGHVNSTRGSCLLLTSRWQRGERYDLRIGFTNPATKGENVGLWVAPVGYEVLSSAGKNLTERRVRYAVGGDKRGQVCALRSGISANLTGSAGDAMAGVVPATNCPGTQALSTRVAGYGECVECQELDFFGAPVAAGQVGATSGSGCTCPATHVVLPVGTRRCGPQRGPPAGGITTEWRDLQLGVSAESSTYGAFSSAGIDPAKVTGDGDLPSLLCNALAAAWLDLKLGTESDAASREYAALFTALASPLLDLGGFFKGNATVAESLAWDPRNKLLAVPTRELGVLPRCSSPGCSTGEYKGRVSGETQKLVDIRYESARVFRALAYLIADISTTECARIYAASHSKWLPDDYFPPDNVCLAL